MTCSWDGLIQFHQCLQNFEKLYEMSVFSDCDSLHVYPVSGEPLTDLHADVPHGLFGLESGEQPSVVCEVQCQFNELSKVE